MNEKEREREREREREKSQCQCWWAKMAAPSCKPRPEILRRMPRQRRSTARKTANCIRSLTYLCCATAFVAQQNKVSAISWPACLPGGSGKRGTSGCRTPSMEQTKGMKVPQSSSAAVLYFVFFAFAARLATASQEMFMHVAGCVDIHNAIIKKRHSAILPHSPCHPVARSCERPLLSFSGFMIGSTETPPHATSASRASLSRVMDKIDRYGCEGNDHDTLAVRRA